MTLEALIQDVTRAFRTRYQRDPQWVVAAPGRVNLIGEHTDYNDGFVFPMAIERYTVIAAARPISGANGTITWMANELQEDFIVDASQPILKGSPKWSNYVRGVLAGCQQKGIPLGGFDALMGTTVPIGGGLSSSAALEVAAATLIETISGKQLDPVEKALLCQRAEHDYAGVPCGIMDQFVSVMGRKDHLLLLDCRSRTPELVPMSDNSVAILIFNTNVKHELSGGEYAERRAHCEEAARTLGIPALRDATLPMLEASREKLGPVAFRRARHVVGENDRTTQAAAAIRKGDWKQVGSLMYASHESLRDDYEVSCAELDVVVNLARQIGVAGGVFGCRMTGGGFGGCTVALIKASATDSISKKLVDGYKREVGIEPTVFVSRPAAGATVIKG
ncbi:MAG: galactokinase [Verrucomicrobia bacterium]|jgi:galactokinase|nr:galactokinase [Verrucomicrobiota bacterium]